MFKLLGGELKKIFLKPLIYIMAIILCASLVASLLLYKPESKTNSASGFTIAGNTVEETKANFATKKNTLDQSIETLKTNLDVYLQTNKTLEIQNFKNVNEKSIQTLLNEYNTINTKGVAYYGGETSYLNDYLTPKLEELNTALIGLKVKYEELISPALPVVKLTSEVEKNISSILKDAIDQTTPPTTTLTINGHKSINELIQKNNYGKSLSDNFALIKDVEISEEDIDYLKENYLGEEFYKRQNELNISILASKSKPELLDFAKKYNSNVNTVSSLVYLKIYSQIVDGLSDGEIQKLYKSDELNLRSGFNEGSATEYGIKEKIALNNYLWSNNKYDFDYSYASNGNTTTGKEITAIDYCLNAIQVTSFLIIIFCVILGATSISSEINNGTIKIIAIKPISRTSIIMAKILATTIFGIIFTFFTGLTAFGIGWFAYGLPTGNILSVFNATTVLSLSPIIYLLIYVICNILQLFVFVSLSIMLSTLFKNNIPSLIIALVVFFAGSIISSMLPSTDIIAYLPLINLNMFVYFGGCTSASSNMLSSLFSPVYLNNNQLWITLSYVIVLPLIFNLISMSVFKNRDIQ